MDKRPIGVFDSGIGGLTVLKELIEQLPGEDIIYLGDTARIPYGPRSKETVIKYSMQCAEFLQSQGVKMIVVACNTATARALTELQDSFNLPVMGVIEPGGKAAALATKNSRIGVLGTAGTIESKSYEKQIRRYLPDAEIIGAACPLFVQLVEEGWENTEVAELTARKYLIDLKDHDVDTLVLGCTHYPPLRYTINKVMGDDVSLINPAMETARETRKIVEDLEIGNGKFEGGAVQFFVSDAPEKFAGVGNNIVRMSIEKVKKIDIEPLATMEMEQEGVIDIKEKM